MFLCAISCVYIDLWGGRARRGEGGAERKAEVRLKANIV